MEIVFVSLGAFVASLPVQVVAYEGTIFPETLGWERRVADTPGAERSLSDGWFIQFVDLPEGWPNVTGDADFYRVSLQTLSGSQTFFVEWRTQTDNPPELLDLSAVPAVVSAAGKSAIYHTTLTDGRIQLFRTTRIPLVFVDVAPDVPHVYRVELQGAETFAWYIDGKVVESGSPLSAYPDSSAFLIWGTRRSYVDATTRWDYIRFGVIPQDASGDFDSKNGIDLFDLYYFHECLTNVRIGINGGPDNDAGPGCRWADFDLDADVDLSDAASFQNAFGEP